MKKILTALIAATVITMPLTVSDTANAQWVRGFGYRGLGWGHGGWGYRGLGYGRVSWGYVATAATVMVVATVTAATVTVVMLATVVVVAAAQLLQSPSFPLS